MSAAGGRAASAPLVGRESEPTMFELSSPGRSAAQLRATGIAPRALDAMIPAPHRRDDRLVTVDLAERDLVGTSRASAPASTRWTWGRTRWARAP